MRFFIELKSDIGTPINHIFLSKGQITLGHAMNFLQMHVLMGRISLQSIVNSKLSPAIKALPLKQAFQDKSSNNAPQTI